MIKQTRQFCSTLPARFAGLAGILFCCALLFSPIQTQAQTTEAPITETNIFGSGSGLPPGALMAAVTGSVNGTQGTISATQTAFSMNKVVIPGDAGTVTITYNISATLPDDSTVSATISFTVSTSTGAVSVTGSDGSGGTLFGATATLNADGGTSTVDTSGGSLSATATGDPDDRMVRTCVRFAAGMRVCADVYSISDPANNPTAGGQNDPANSPNGQPNGPGGAANGSGGTGTLSGANYSDAIQMFADQMAIIMIYQLPIIGEMLDAKHQLETQRIFGAVAAQAFREYQPSEQVCAFGTLARSTAPSRFKVDDNIGAIDLILQKRETLNANQASAWGPSADQNVRLDKYKSVYCDPNDNAGEIEKAAICTTTGSGLRRNKDIDWRRTVEANMTMDVDFTDGAITEDEEDVLSLAKNLYASDVVTPIPETAIAPYGTYRELQDSRMLSAIRSVERYSYASIVAAKARGSGLNATQLRQVLQNLGVPAADVTQLVGENPSYFTQMDFFTQKMFQDPGFYTGLYTSPANVVRMKVVLQAIRLMADRDRFEQSLRREMLVSLILEMRLRAVQEGTTNTTNDVRAKSR
ncbi:MAG: hypothetical protein JWO78_2371 [Micavibrio sp.]|nr:hypothetical protein [Micavibrio sp.]